MARRGLEPLVGSSPDAEAALDPIQEARTRELVCAVTGRDRVALLDAIAGAALFAGREIEGPPVRIRRGQRDRGIARGDGVIDRFPSESLQAPEPRTPWWAPWRWLGRWLRRRSSAAAPTDLASWLERAARRPSTTSIELQLAGARLPEGVVIVDGDPRRMGIEVDGWLAIGPGEPGLEAIGLSGLFSVDGARPIPELESALERLAWKRAERLARPALAAISAAHAELHEQVERAEAELATRAAAVDELRFDDPDGFARQAIESARSSVIQLARQLIDQLSSQLSTELDQLGRRWSAEVGDAVSGELRGITARIASESPEQLAAIHAGLNRLLQAALRGTTHQLFAEAVASLPHREGAPRPESPDPRTVEIAAALVSSNVPLVSPPSRVGDLFRSADTRKERLVESLSERVSRLRQLALSDLLDGEPTLESALIGPLREALVDAARAHARSLSDRRAAERLAIASERARLEPAIRLRDHTAAAAEALGRALER